MDDGWEHNGTKRWITNAGEGDTYAVFAVTDPGTGKGRHVSCFMASKTDPGVSSWQTRAQARDQGITDARDVLGLRAAAGRSAGR